MPLTVKGAQARITAAVTNWEGVSARPHRFGGVEYDIGRREIGHIHGDTQVDIPFPVRVREELVAAGDAQHHHILPDSGWITFRMRRPADVAHAIDLLQKSYDLAVRQKRRRGETGG